MKSKSGEYNCKGCIFAETAGPDPVQIGCEAGREKLYQRKPLTDGYHDLTRFCNMYRPVEWAEGRDPEKCKADAELEVRPWFGVVVYDQLDKDINEIRKTMDSVVDAAREYNPKKVGCVLAFCSDKRPIGTTTDISNHYTLEEKIACKNIYIWTEDPVEAEREIWEKVTRATHFVKLSSGDTIDKNFFKDIDQSIHYDLEKVLCFENNGNFAICKRMARSLYHDFNNYDLMESCVVNTCKDKGYYKKI